MSVYWGWVSLSQQWGQEVSQANSPGCSGRTLSMVRLMISKNISILDKCFTYK